MLGGLGFYSSGESLFGGSAYIQRMSIEKGRGTICLNPKQCRDQTLGSGFCCCCYLYSGSSTTFEYRQWTER